jgi:hypothetical protein
VADGGGRAEPAPPQRARSRLKRAPKHDLRGVELRVVDRQLPLLAQPREELPAQEDLIEEGRRVVSNHGRRVHGVKSSPHQRTWEEKACTTMDREGMHNHG